MMGMRGQIDIKPSPTPSGAISIVAHTITLQLPRLS
jgi:hypothetical protein